MDTPANYGQLTGSCSAALPARFHNLAGWFLLFSAVASAALCGFSLPGGSTSSAASVAAQNRAFEAHVMIAVLGIFELAVQPLWQKYFAFPERRITTQLRGTGSLLAALGYGLGPYWSHAPWLIATGAVMNLALLIELGSRLRRCREAGSLTILVTIFGFGMLLSAVLALAELQAESLGFSVLGPYDGFPLRTLRLARVAAIVLPVLDLLYQALLKAGDFDDALARLGRRANLCGVVGMAPLLFASGMIFAPLKTLLVIPSVAIFVGVFCGFRLAYRDARRLEAWGWLLMTVSMAGGLAMGLYAFADPWLTLAFAGDYNSDARRLARWAHVSAVLLGLAAIFASRQFASAAENSHGGRS